MSDGRDRGRVSSFQTRSINESMNIHRRAKTARQHPDDFWIELQFKLDFQSESPITFYGTQFKVQPGADPGQVRAGPGRSGQVRAGPGRSGRVGACPGSGSGQVRAGSGRWGQVRAGAGGLEPVPGQARVKFGQVRAGGGGSGSVPGQVRVRFGSGSGPSTSSGA